MNWNRPAGSGLHGRDVTLARVIETIDGTAPETKAELADALGLSEHYLSELLQELKADGIVKKAYVVDEAAVYAGAPAVSELHRDDDAPRRETLLSALERLDETTFQQYEAARTEFEGESPEQTADALEPLANERCLAVFDELKSLTLTMDWPGNRIAADLGTIAMAMEVVGDRACFVADVARSSGDVSAGIVRDRLASVFEGGEEINGHLGAVLFDGRVERIDDLYAREKDVHRTLDELFELVTAYDPDSYGRLVTVTRALERSIYYWVHAAEIAVRLHTGIDSEHLSNLSI